MSLLSDPTQSVKSNGETPGGQNIATDVERWLALSAEEQSAAAARKWREEMSPAERRASQLPPKAPSGKNSEANWRSRLILGRNGSPSAVLANAALALREAPAWQDALAYDEFASATVATKSLPWEASWIDRDGRPWTTQFDARTAEWLQQHGILCGLEVAQQAVEMVAADRCFHPVRDYLGGLSWDGEPRIEQMFSRYFGAPDGAYVREVSKRFLISAVARIAQPGCKADHVPILEGAQGIGKSSGVKALAEPWFTDELGELGSKDAALQTRGAWLIELAELDGMSRAEAARIKAFISRSTDRFRPPYGKRVIESPRQCVFVGTTNADAYLKDETGSRRFWPIRAGAVGTDAIARDRDQLWAEATALYLAGQQWWLDTSVARAAAEQQAERYIGDPWEEAIAAFVLHRTDVSVPELLVDALHLDKGRWSQVEQNRVARCLRARGWKRYQRRSGGMQEWRYRLVSSAAEAVTSLRVVTA